MKTVDSVEWADRIAPWLLVLVAILVLTIAPGDEPPAATPSTSPTIWTVDQ